MNAQQQLEALEARATELDRTAATRFREVEKLQAMARELAVAISERYEALWRTRDEIARLLEVVQSDRNELAEYRSRLSAVVSELAADFEAEADDDPADDWKRA